MASIPPQLQIDLLTSKYPNIRYLVKQKHLSIWPNSFLWFSYNAHSKMAIPLYIIWFQLLSQLSSVATVPRLRTLSVYQRFAHPCCRETYLEVTDESHEKTDNTESQRPFRNCGNDMDSVSLQKTFLKKVLWGCFSMVEYHQF